jgi:hypothetical protein
MRKQLVIQVVLFPTLVSIHALGSLVAIFFAFFLCHSPGWDGTGNRLLWIYFFPSRLFALVSGISLHVDDMIEGPRLVCNSAAWVACGYAIWLIGVLTYQTGLRLFARQPIDHGNAAPRLAPRP